MAVAEMNKQTQAQREQLYFATLFKADGSIEDVRPILAGTVRRSMRTFADKLLSGEIRGFYCGVEGE